MSKANVPINIYFTPFKNAIKCHLLGNNVNNQVVCEIFT